MLYLFIMIDDQYIKTKMKMYSGKVYNTFRGLNMPENGVEYKLFAIIPIDYSITYEKKYDLQVYLDNCACKIVNAEMLDYLDDNLFETD